MSFYKNSCEEIETIIRKTYPDILPFRHKGLVKKENLPPHLLWLVNEMRTWDTSSIKRAAKAGRWVGWMFRAMEELDMWNNNSSRKLAKRDVDEGYHLPEEGVADGL